ncbi:MAG: asparagine synthase (glutamine-hydrolyzing), partial [Proteobacteria bacterium]
MGEILRLRGPDEQNIYQDDVLSFVFRRLSIVDLKGGSQPIWNEDESIFVSVNGEIYNHIALRKQLPGQHRFRTDSDSEIVLHLYEAFGVDVFSMLNGMFSLVIWDKNKQQLVMARDRLGIKPLYYSLNDDRLIFGSELKALLVHPDCPRVLKWSDLEQVGVQQKSEVSSYIEGVLHFPAGHYATWQPDKPLSFQSYWNIADSFNRGEDLSVADIENRYDELLEDAVQKRLMADVPVGLFLSGGIDSSLIAALLAKHNANVHCFTVVEKSTYQSGDVENAKKVTESMGLPFYPVLFDLKDMAQQFQLADLECMVGLIESPRFDPEWFFKSELHRTAKTEVPDIKVMLLGQGADEFAGGYSKYLGSEWRHWDDYILHDVKPSLKSHEQENKRVPDRFIQGLRDKDFIDKSISPYQQKMKALTYQLQYFNLWHEDRSSAYHGIESRVPFLDHRLVELLASVPEKHHQTLFWDKKLVRNTLRKHLADYPGDHKKVPFFVTDKRNSIQKFIIDITKNIYPTFITEYVNQSKSLFEKEDMDDLYLRLSKYNQQSEMAAWYLLERMSITICQEFCQNTKQFLD